jgi:hypothetical protein
MSFLGNFPTFWVVSALQKRICAIGTVVYSPCLGSRARMPVMLATRRLTTNHADITPHMPETDPADLESIHAERAKSMAAAIRPLAIPPTAMSLIRSDVLMPPL